MRTSECAASVKPVERSKTRQQKGQSKRKETKERHGVWGVASAGVESHERFYCKDRVGGDANMRKRPRKTSPTRMLST